MAKATNWIVTTKADRSIHDVAKDLAAAGFAVRNVLEEIGTITGSADGTKVGALKRIQGIEDIAADSEIHLGPPDADHTW
jgi:hypothetical protein